MEAHQIIQTSCRKGIQGGGSGFQIFSCDKSLANQGILNGTEFQRLFVYDTPTEVGISSFGYAFVEGVGSIFSVNTRLAHDFAGEGTRSGNLLNHSLVVENDLDFYPAELFGSNVFRSSMQENEVNNGEQPAYLPLVDIKPSGTISLDAVAEWLNNCNSTDILLKLILTYLEAKAQGKTVILLEDPTNVVRWVAALEYCLPIKLAQKINIVNYSEIAASTKASIAGTSREQFEAHTPSYMISSAMVFDPNNLKDSLKTQGPFFDFIDISYSLNPSAITQFTTFVHNHVKLDKQWDIHALNNAYCLYSLVFDNVQKLETSTIQAGLNYAPIHGSTRLNSRLVSLLTQNYGQLVEELDSDTNLHVLKYLILRWPCLEISAQNFVEKVAANNVIEILRKPNIDEWSFQNYFSAITKTCASVKLNLFEVMLKDEYFTNLFESGRLLGLPKLKQLAISLTEFALTSGQSAESLSKGNTFDKLYASIIYSAITQSVAGGLNIAQKVMTLSIGKLSYFENLTLSLERAIKKGICSIKGADSTEEMKALYALWDTCVTLIAEKYANQVKQPVSWLLSTAHFNFLCYEYLAILYDKVSQKFTTIQENVALFNTFCNCSTLGNSGFMEQTYPLIAKHYAASLATYEGKAAESARLCLLEELLSSNCELDFIPHLMDEASQSFNLKKPAHEDLCLTKAAYEYESRTNNIALVGKAALLHAKRMLEDSQKLNNPRKVVGKLEELSSTLRVDKLDQRSCRGYLKAISHHLTLLVHTDDDIYRVIKAYHLHGDTFLELIADMYTDAVKRFTRKGDDHAVIALNTYVARENNRRLDSICIKVLSSIKNQDFDSLTQKTTRIIRSSTNKAACKHWNEIMILSANKSNRPSFKKFYL